MTTPWTTTKKNCVTQCDKMVEKMRGVFFLSSLRFINNSQWDSHSFYREIGIYRISCGTIYFCSRDTTILQNGQYYKCILRNEKEKKVKGVGKSMYCWCARYLRSILCPQKLWHGFSLTFETACKFQPCTSFMYNSHFQRKKKIPQWAEIDSLTHSLTHTRTLPLNTTVSVQHNEIQIKN